MITEFDIYSLGLVHGVHIILTVVIIVTFFVGSISIIARSIMVSEESKQSKDSEKTSTVKLITQILYKSLIISFSCLILNEIIPSQKVLAAMYVIPQLEQSQVIKNVPAILLKLENQYIDEFKPRNNVKH